MPSMCLLAVLLFASLVQAAQPAKKAGRSLHGQAWAFGVSQSRNDALWHKGIDAGNMSKKAVPPKRKSVDTSGGIKRALNKAEKTRGKLGLSMKNRSSSWKVDPNAVRADEFRPRDRQHVVRAYAGVKAGKNLDINIGPELILRDERAGEESAHEKQPDSSLGLGMAFKYDF